MKLTREEIKWLEAVKNEPDVYSIEVDNGDVYVVETFKSKQGFDKLDSQLVFTFNDYGQDFIVKLLNTLGYNADWV